jgi:hypothetical protein
MTGFDVVWHRIVALQGQTFHQKTGKPFRYRVPGNSVVPSTTNRQLPRSHFARAYERAPIDGPGQLQDLQGPSYLYAILTDPRVLADEPRGASSPPDGSPGSSDAATDGRPPYAALARSAGIGAGADQRRRAPANLVREPAASMLGQIDPRRALLIIPCSAAKVRGGQPPLSAPREEWPEALRRARAQVLADADLDTSGDLPAWRRYDGGFYRSARPALTAAAAAGSVVIISGGYGIVRAQELIGWYDKVLRLADWPPSLLESALIEQARRAGSDTVVAFVAATTPYAQLLRRTPWRDADLSACLVTITGVTGGAMAEVPRRLGLAFAAFWDQEHDSYPPGTTAEQLS